MQARLNVHSLLETHSGRQFGGRPIKSGKQEQEGEPFIILQAEYGPQGDGSHGLTGLISKMAAVKYVYIYIHIAEITLITYAYLCNVQTDSL